MTNVPGFRELPRFLLAILFMALTIIASLWILRPFLPALIWSTLIVVSTWPLMLMVQRRLWRKRGLAVIVMTTALLLVVILPLALAVLTITEHADDVAGRLKALAHAGVPAPPGWVEQVPLVGPKLAASWQAVAALSSDELQARVAPYAKGVAGWILSKAGGLAAFFLHLLLTVIISVLLYYKGEAAAAGLRAFARRLAGPRGEQSVMLAGQAIRAVALGVVVTALRAGRARRHRPRGGRRAVRGCADRGHVRARGGADRRGAGAAARRGLALLERRHVDGDGVSRRGPFSWAPSTTCCGRCSSGAARTCRWC